MTAKREKSDNEEIFLNDSDGWTEEAEGIINDVKEHVKEITIAKSIQVSVINQAPNQTTNVCLLKIEY